jgi:hypothetical protein
MEPPDWINDQLREELKDLQRTPGFEEDEALAFWLLQQTAKQMNALRRVDILKEMGRHEGRPDQLALQHAIVLDHVARWHAGIHQHFIALREALGARVLRRAFPEGWGLVRSEDMDTEADLAIKCATYSRSDGGRKIRGSSVPETDTYGISCFSWPRFSATPNPPRCPRVYGEV